MNYLYNNYVQVYVDNKLHQRMLMALSGEPKHTFCSVVTNKLITSYTLQHMYIAMYMLIVLIWNLLMHTVIGRTADQTVRQMFSLLLQNYLFF